MRPIIKTGTLPGMCSELPAGPAGIGTSATNLLWLRSDEGTSTTDGGDTIEE